MGGRGGDSGISSKRVEYSMKKRGQITRYEAGVLYKAVKNQDIKALPETVSMMYDEADKYIRFANERYSQNYRFYDRVEEMTRDLLNGNKKKAQKIIREIETDMIKRAGKKSRYYKYQKNS